MALTYLGCTTNAPPISPGETSPARSGPGTAAENETKGSRTVKPATFVIFDPDKPSAGHERIKVPSATEGSKVIALVFPKALTSASQCGETQGSLEEQRSKGLLVPRSVGMVEGSFTSARLAEKLYVLSVGECNASHRDNGGSVRLVVLRDGRNVASAEVEGGTSVVGVVDVDGEGRDEVILYHSYINQGDLTTSGSLVRLRSTDVEEVKGFDTGGVHCGDDDAKADVMGVTRGVVTATRSAKGEVTFSESVQEHKCGE
jgi:hypothetical protein